jgi:hypothetical protein
LTPSPGRSGLTGEGNTDLQHYFRYSQGSRDDAKFQGGECPQIARFLPI